MLAENTGQAESDLQTGEEQGMGMVKRERIILPFSNPITIGEDLINIVDPEENLPPADRARLLALADRDALEKFVEENLGDTITIELQNAQRILGLLVTRKFNVPELLMVWRFYSIASCRRAIENSEEVMRNKSCTMDEQVKALNIQVEACKSLDRLITNAQKMMDLIAPRDRSKEARLKRAIKKGKVPADKPKMNLPPDLSLPISVASQAIES